MTRTLDHMMIGRLALVVVVVASSVSVSDVRAAELIRSRVYVTAYACPGSADGGPLVDAGAPHVSLFDERDYGDSPVRDSVDLPVTLTSRDGDRVSFTFDVTPGSYRAYLYFPDIKPEPGRVWRNCSASGPLVVIPGKDRRLVVAACDCIADWHSDAAIAGTLPMPGVGVQVLVYDHPMHCGDDIRSFDSQPKVLPRVTRGVIDDGAYYANFHAYGKQDRTIALGISGAFFSSGAILLTETPDTSPGKPPMIRKDITTAIVRAAATSRDKLACIPGF